MTHPEFSKALKWTENKGFIVAISIKNDVILRIPAAAAGRIIEALATAGALASMILPVAAAASLG